jgi:hypothetical protein
MLTRHFPGPCSNAVISSPFGTVRKDFRSAGCELKMLGHGRNDPHPRLRLRCLGRSALHPAQCFGFARDLHFPNDLARIIHYADAGLLDRNVQSGKMIHAALLLLMLGARYNGDPVRFTISLKRSTQKPFSYPQAAGRLPHLWVKSGHRLGAR